MSIKNLTAQDILIAIIQDIYISSQKMMFLALIFLTFGCIKEVEKLSTNWRDQVSQTLEDQNDFNMQDGQNESAQYFIN